MRVFRVHSFYGSGSPSGENVAFQNEGQLLRSGGAIVRDLTRTSDSLRSRGLVGSVIGGLITPWNFSAARDAGKSASEFSPDIIHVHNTFPLFSSSVFRAFEGIAPRIMTLHNFRLFCASGIPSRNNRVCFDCLDKRSVVPGLIGGCYRGGFFSTVPIAANISLNRFLGTWQRQVEAFIVFTEWHKKIFAGAGLDPEKIYVRPNFSSFDGSKDSCSSRDCSSSNALGSPYCVYVGRLSEEKGIGTLVKCWKRYSARLPRLVIVGSGPLESLVRSAGSSNIDYIGALGRKEVEGVLRRASALVIPSECVEGFPMVLSEAFSLGIPVIASDVGPLTDIIQESSAGRVFRMGCVDSLADTLEAVFHHSDVLGQLAFFARKYYDMRLHPDRALESLLSIYSSVLSKRSAA